MGQFRWSKQRLGPALHARVIFTQGPPFDGGRNYSHLAAKMLELFGREFDSVVSFTPTDVGKYFPDHPVWNLEASVLEQSKKFPGVRFNSAWARVGYMSWKPLAILHWLDSPSVKASDLVYFHDVDYERYPVYLEGVADQRGWILSKIRKNDLLVFSDYSRDYSVDIRPDLLSQVQVPWSKRLNPLPLWGGALVVRKSPRARAIIQSWADACTVARLQPSHAGPAPKDFVRHSADQSVLNLLFLQRKVSCAKKVYLREFRRLPPGPFTATVTRLLMKRRVAQWKTRR